jgi:hypothetical protein
VVPLGVLGLVKLSSSAVREVIVRTCGPSPTRLAKVLPSIPRERVLSTALLGQHGAGYRFAEQRRAPRRGILNGKPHARIGVAGQQQVGHLPVQARSLVVQKG